MRRVFIASLAVLLYLEPVAALSPDTISRRDGFLLIWKSIQRPVDDVREKPFSDVPLESSGGREITYAKARGILDDENPMFRPDDSLMLSEAFLMMLRTRNVAEIDELTERHLHDLAIRYGFPDVLVRESNSSIRTFPMKAVSGGELQKLIARLDAFLALEEHEVSLYSEKFHGKGTAFGESFDMHAMTAAHRTFPHKTLVRVTNVANGKSVIVRINDRGPYVAGRDMDLSLGAFTTIAERSKGKIQATFERLGDARIVNGCGGDPVYRRKIGSGVYLEPGLPAKIVAGTELTLRSEQRFQVKSLRLPDGSIKALRTRVSPGDAFRFTPEKSGDYWFTFRTLDARTKTLLMRVIDCR